MKKINWTTVIAVIILGLLILQLAMGIFGGWRGSSWRMGPGMMGGWGYGPFGWFGGMFIMWLIPLGLILLVVLGINWLVRNISGGTNQTTQTCPACGRGTQTDWKNCPYCGTSLSK